MARNNMRRRRKCIGVEADYHRLAPTQWVGWYAAGPRLGWRPVAAAADEPECVAALLRYVAERRLEPARVAVVEPGGTFAGPVKYAVVGADTITFHDG